MNAANFFCELAQTKDAEDALKPLLTNRGWKKNSAIAACHARVLLSRKQTKPAPEDISKITERESNIRRKLDEYRSLPKPTQ